MYCEFYIMQMTTDNIKPTYQDLKIVELKLDQKRTEAINEVNNRLHQLQDDFNMKLTELEKSLLKSNTRLATLYVVFNVLLIIVGIVAKIFELF